MEIKGIKGAVKDYRSANKYGFLSPSYGYLMIDLEDGEVWTDYFCSIGHNNWNEYHKDSIVNLINYIQYIGVDIRDEPVNASNVKAWAEKAVAHYAKTHSAEV